MKSINYYQKSFFKNDWKSGISVFLVALPLCLGIALASGAPLFAGLISGVVGGVVIGMLSGSQLSVSGPAAGLTVIVASAITELGSYPGFLVAVVLAGIMQLGLGFLKAGKFSAYFPNSVIKGMLVAIGIVIILKQIPHALGDDQDFEGEFEFNQIADNENTLSEIIRSFVDFNTGALLISLSCLLLMYFWEKLAKQKYNLFKSMPASLAAVVLGIVINELFSVYKQGYFLGGSLKHMVSVPVFSSLNEFSNSLIFPDFSFLNNSKIYIVAITLATVASLESLLSLEAGDSLDPEKRISSSNKELIAQGTGNIISGFLGGLPVTSVVVRTSTNIYSGAKTRVSAIFHGFLLIAAVFLIPTLINKIPLASLAAVLLMVGYKLASPAVFKKVYKEGFDQFIPFIITILVIVFKDLLWGIFIGTAVGLLFVLRTNFKNVVSYVRDGKSVLMKFNKDVYFLNKPQIKEILMNLNDGDEIMIDGTKATFIDHDIYSILDEFKKGAKDRNIDVDFKNIVNSNNKNITLDLKK
jgi:MFS superfamily sulfate permease-like transporter